MKLRIAISLGDMNGIGPEVVLKTLAEADLAEITPILLGSGRVVHFYLDNLGIELPLHEASASSEIEEGTINVLESYRQVEYELRPGELSKKAGKCAMLAVERGIKLCMDNKADALVTAPISKEAVNMAGYDIPGHTEFLAEKTGTTDYMMMLVTDKLRVGLATIHVPLRRVASLITEANITRHLRIMHRSLRNDFGIAEPRIAVLGLNPHAGDGGYIGDEEIRIISPALQKARFNNMDLDGPLPADGFFGNRRYEHYDAILAMYHDQGLIPFKALSFGAGVNFTAGLPIIRTSPDHGTAFDIAGKKKASPDSFRTAFKLACKLARNRKKVYS